MGDLTKAEIIIRGNELAVPFHLIWSCYEDGEVHCGRCPSCLRLKSALSKEEIPKTPIIAFQG